MARWLAVEDEGVAFAVGLQPGRFEGKGLALGHCCHFALPFAARQAQSGEGDRGAMAKDWPRFGRTLTEASR